jgi:tetratricopeptide (TPR) repeat protein
MTEQLKRLEEVRHRSLTAFIAYLVTALAFCAPSMSLAQAVASGCGSLGNAFGPFDYRSDHYIPEDTFRSHAAQLNIVERAHFTPEVEALLRGKSSAIGEDIGYTLRAFPNHHRALYSMARLGEKLKTDKPEGSLYTVECWFRRAIAWRQEDNIVRLLYAKFLVDSGRRDDAAKQLTVVESNAKQNAFTLNNIGLIYFDMKDYDKALTFAHKAYDLGMGGTTLKDLLVTVGKWSDAKP